MTDTTVTTDETNEIDEKTVVATCCNCNNDITEDDEAPHHPEASSQAWCDECYHENFTSCECCDDVVKSEDIVSCGEGGALVRRSGLRNPIRYDYLCESCADIHYPQCADCNERGSLDYQNCDGDGICWDCQENYFTCNSCENICRSDDYSSDGNCNDCDVSNKTLKPYSTNVLDTLPICSIDRNKLLFGIELEVECRANNELADDLAPEISDYAILKEDSSLSNGLEIVTSPRQFNDAKDIICDTSQALSKLQKEHCIQSHNTSSCGMHIHASAKFIPKLTIGKMRVFLCDINNKNLLECIAQRNYFSNRYCAPHQDQFSSKISTRWCGNRFVPLNITHKKTIELRIFKGNLRKDRLLKNLEFYQSLISYCNTTSIQDYNNCNSFLNYVTKHQKVYPHLVAFLVEKGYIDAKIVKSATLPLAA